MTPKNAFAILALSLVALGGAGCAALGGKSQGASGAGAGATARTDGDVSFLAADLNHDGRVTLQEFERWEAARGDARGRDAFGAADMNLDGVLTLDEWQALVGGASAAAGGTRRPPSSGVRP